MFRINPAAGVQTATRSESRTRRSAAKSSFDSYLTSSLSGRRGELRQASQATPQAAVAALQSQDSVTSQKSVSPQPAVQPLGPSAVAALQEAMRKCGLDPASCQLSYTEDTVGYPGGSYTNKNIRVEVGGKTTDLMAELVLKNPAVAVGDMLRLMRSTA